MDLGEIIRNHAAQLKLQEAATKGPEALTQHMADANSALFAEANSRQRNYVGLEPEQREELKDLKNTRVTRPDPMDTRFSVLSETKRQAKSLGIPANIVRRSDPGITHGPPDPMFKEAITRQQSWLPTSAQVGTALKPIADALGFIFAPADAEAGNSNQDMQLDSLKAGRDLSQPAQSARPLGPAPITTKPATDLPKGTVMTEKQRIQKNLEMDAVEARLRGVPPKPKNETEEQRLRRTHPELY